MKSTLSGALPILTLTSLLTCNVFAQEQNSMPDSDLNALQHHCASNQQWSMERKSCIDVSKVSGAVETPKNKQGNANNTYIPGIC
jgi:hypothetical protein